MTKKEAKEIMCKVTFYWELGEQTLTQNQIDEAIDLAIKALEQQPCEDCISREAVDEYITNLLSGYLYDEERTRLEDLTAYIWELPSVTPKTESKNVFDKIRAEIEQKCCITVGSENEPAITLYDVFQIIDKYRTESEE